VHHGELRLARSLRLRKDAHFKGEGSVMALIFRFGIFALLLSISPARADWQYTKWGMSPEDLMSLGKGNIVRASQRESSPNNEDVPGRGRGTTMAIKADLVLRSAFIAEGMTYNALFYFNTKGLFVVALIPQSKEDGLKTSKLLNDTYGAPEGEERLGRDEGYVGGCIVRRRWRSRPDGNLITFFNLCGDRFEVRYEPIPTKGGL
jgi:hypothetical protein